MFLELGWFPRGTGGGYRSIGHHSCSCKGGRGLVAGTRGHSVLRKALRGDGDRVGEGEVRSLLTISVPV